MRKWGGAMGKRPAEPQKWSNIRSYSKRVNAEKLGFTSEKIGEPKNCYVAWVDLMGTGHIMSTSVHKAANFLARLHMCVEMAIRESGYSFRTLPINDGIFIVSEKKGELVTVLQHAMTLLAARFIATLRTHDRCLLKGGIAYGPVYEGQQLAQGIRLRKLRGEPQFLERVLFGPPIIQAYKSESAAPPYGIAVHESARAFSPAGEPPFNMTHWLWWQEHDEAKRASGLPSLVDLRDVLAVELKRQFDWMDRTLLLHGISGDVIKKWRAAADQYLLGGAEFTVIDDTT
jgi:hypothetical protein